MDISDKLLISRPLYLKDSECGYCHGKKSLEDSTFLKSWIGHGVKKGHATIGFQLSNCTPAQYDNLVNKNFRRSGNFLYKADNLRNCCFYHTIRTSLEFFKLGKELRHDLNKFNKQLGFTRKNNQKFELWDEVTKFETSDDFEVRFETGYSFTKYELFKKYQENIHKETDTSVKSFQRFLIQHPFPKDAVIKKGWEVVEFGAVQLCYYYKGRLIGVSFLDILPTGVSSIYFIYDDDYKNLSLGKISILFEFLTMKRLGLDYLYLGYYITDCPKMVYKEKFCGELLNPLTFEWVGLKDIDKIHDSIEEKYGYANFDLSIEKKAIQDEIGLSYITDFILEEDSENDHIYEIPLAILESTPITRLLWKKDTLNINILMFDQQMQIVSYDDLHYRLRKVVLDLFRIVGEDLKTETLLSL